MKGCVFLNECLEEDKKNKTFVLVFIHDRAWREESLKFIIRCGEAWREELELIRWERENTSLSMAKLEEKNCWNWQDGGEKRERKEKEKEKEKNT